MGEKEPGKFRLGESTGKPIGGNISPEPFPQALHGLAVSRGYESQKSLGRKLGRSKASIGAWYRGERVPSPELMGELLVLFEPNDQELDMLIDPWRQQLQEGRGIHGSAPGSQAALERGQRQRKPSTTPLGAWFERYSDEQGVSLERIGAKLQVRLDHRDSIGLDSMSQILQNAPDALGLSEHQTETLAEATTRTIEEKLEQGFKFSNSIGERLRKMQQELQCTTFNGAQAAEILGTSRANISLLRQKRGYPLLLTEDNIAEMAIHLERTKEFRSRQQEYWRKRKLHKIA